MLWLTIIPVAAEHFELIAEVRRCFGRSQIRFSHAQSCQTTSRSDRSLKFARSNRLEILVRRYVSVIQHHTRPSRQSISRDVIDVSVLQARHNLAGFCCSAMEKCMRGIHADDPLSFVFLSPDNFRSVPFSGQESWW